MRLVLLVIWLLGSAVATNAARFNCSLAKPDDQERLAFSYAKLLSDSELARINDRLVAFARETSNQFLLVIVDTLCGMEASDLAFEIGERWGIGQQGFDNGLVFLVKPIGGAGDRKVFIATGYGLEGAIPDATCKRIVEEEVIPRFKQGRFAEGVEAALDVLIPLAKGEFDHRDYGRQRVPWGLLLFILVFIAIMVLSWRKRVNSYARTNKLDFWTAMWLLSQMDQRHRGVFRSGHRSGGFGGSSGGGFGGFGGGSFGGGGAGGSW